MHKVVPRHNRSPSEKVDRCTSVRRTGGLGSRCCGSALVIQNVALVVGRVEMGNGSPSDTIDDRRARMKDGRKFFPLPPLSDEGAGRPERRPIRCCGRTDRHFDAGTEKQPS